MFTQLLCCFSLLAFVEPRQTNNFHDLKFLNSSQRHAFIQTDGLTNVHHRGRLGIVNGEPAKRGQFCFAIYLQFTDGQSYWSCTGSLVTPTVILTAAHCLKGAKAGVAVAGATDIKNLKEPGTKIMRFQKDAIKIHEKYDANKIVNDIGIITIKSGVPLNKYVCTVQLPACKATKKPVTWSDIMTILGWGKTSDKTSTTKLMYVQVHGQKQKDCANFYTKYAKYTVVGSQMCTSGADGKSTCNGDSGGPLMNKGVQQGIVSLGFNSCESHAPSVYTDLTTFMGWLCPLIKKK